MKLNRKEYENFLNNHGVTSEFFGNNVKIKK